MSDTISEADLPAGFLRHAKRERYARDWVTARQTSEAKSAATSAQYRLIAKASSATRLAPTPS